MYNSYNLSQLEHISVLSSTIIFLLDLNKAILSACSIFQAPNYIRGYFLNFVFCKGTDRKSWGTKEKSYLTVFLCKNL